MKEKMEIAVFGGGCFWCTEAVFKMLKGVVSVVPGYAGGLSRGPGMKPDYDAVSSGSTGHAEVVKIEFDPAQVPYRTLLVIFFASHDPTTLNRQGADVGTQYRSIILTTTDAQDAEARAFIGELNGSSKNGAPIVTEVKPLDAFFEAEAYHHDYYAQNKGKNQYCEIVINPKLEKVQKEFADLLK